jgi:hypothetical protein
MHPRANTVRHRCARIALAYQDAAPCRARGNAMIHKGIQFSFEQTAMPDIWSWEYQIGRHTKTGRLKAASRKVALRSVYQKIDRDLREIHLKADNYHRQSG